MLLFKKAFHAGLSSGAITLTFRRWDKPRVRPGGRYRCHPIGVLEVDQITRVTAGAITAADAAQAGFADRAALLAYLGELGPVTEATELWRVALHHGGDGDRVEVALDATLSPGDVEVIRGKLARMDRDGPWTAATLAIIAARPQVVARLLAAALGRETLPFKIDVRKLKKLGLTQSFEIGYELSPRGRAYVEAVGAAPSPPPKPSPKPSPKPKASSKPTPPRTPTRS